MVPYDATVVKPDIKRGFIVGKCYTAYFIVCFDCLELLELPRWSFALCLGFLGVRWRAGSRAVVLVGG